LTIIYRITMFRKHCLFVCLFVFVIGCLYFFDLLSEVSVLYIYSSLFDLWCKENLIYLIVHVYFFIKKCFNVAMFYIVCLSLFNFEDILGVTRSHTSQKDRQSNAMAKGKRTTTKSEGCTKLTGWIIKVFKLTLVIL
jgi:hypothetical protein